MIDAIKDCFHVLFLIFRDTIFSVYRPWAFLLSIFVVVAKVVAVFSVAYLFFVRRADVFSAIGMLVVAFMAIRPISWFIENRGMR